MRIVLKSEIKRERCNAEALGLFNAAVGVNTMHSTSSFEKVDAKALVDHFNETHAKKTSGLKWNDKVSMGVWDKNGANRIYLNGVGYNTKKVKQSVYVDLNTGNLHVYTNSSQPYKWNISQSDELKNSSTVQSLYRYIRRFKK